MCNFVVVGVVAAGAVFDEGCVATETRPGEAALSASVSSAEQINTIAHETIFQSKTVLFITRLSFLKRFRLALLRPHSLVINLESDPCDVYAVTPIDDDMDPPISVYCG